MRDAISLRYNLNSDNHQFDTVVVVRHLCEDHLLVDLEKKEERQEFVITVIRSEVRRSGRNNWHDKIIIVKILLIVSSVE